MHQVAVYERLKTMQYYKTVKPTSSHRGLEKCSFMGGFLWEGFDWENFGVLDRWSFMEGAHL